MKKSVFSILLTLLVLAVSTTHSASALLPVAQVNVEELNAVFIQDGQNPNSPQMQQKMLKMLHILRQIPEASRVLDDARQKFGIVNDQDFLTWIVWIDSNVEHPPARAVINHQRLITSRAPNFEVELGHPIHWTPGNEEVLNNAYHFTTCHNLAYICAFAYERPTIEILRGRTFTMVVSSFIHELTHLTYLPWDTELPLTTAANPADYINQTILRPGGEQDAYIKQALVIHALKRAYPTLETQTFNVLTRHVGEQGQVSNPSQFLTMILDLGYRQSLNTLLNTVLNRELEETVHRFNQLGPLQFYHEQKAQNARTPRDEQNWSRQYAADIQTYREQLNDYRCDLLQRYTSQRCVTSD